MSVNREIARLGCVVFMSLAIAACDSPFADRDNSASLRVPAFEGFPAVADALQPSCGTLDCHGQKARNLRMYGGRGLRIAAGDTSAEGPTTPAEYEGTYRSFVGLEPEQLDQVLRGGDVESLSLIRKSRGTERHKGGIQMLRNDPLDICLTSFLQDQINQDQINIDMCWRVSHAPRPEVSQP